MKFISSLELIESPVEKLALKGLPNEITLLRSNLRTSVISGNRKIMNDIRDAEGEIQCNGQIKHASEASSQVKNLQILKPSDLIVKKVIIPAEWEKKLAESSSIDSNGVSESNKMAPGFATHKVNKVYLESVETDVPKEDSTDIDLLKSKPVHSSMLDTNTSIPEQSATETSNGQLDDSTNRTDEWSNEASNPAGEESLSNSHSSHMFATTVTNDCSAKMPLQIESCSPKNVENDVEMHESSTFLGIHAKDVEKCDSQENEAENSENLNSNFTKEHLDTALVDKINNITHPDDQVSEQDLTRNCQDNVLMNDSNVTTDTRGNVDVESKEDSGNFPKSYDASTVEENEFEERSETFSFCDKLAAGTIHNTDDYQGGNDFSSISSEGSNSRLADIVEDLENMDSLQASNAQFDNTCEAVDQSDNLDELNSEYQVEEPDDDNDDYENNDDISGLNDFVEAGTENSSEIDIQDNVEDLENIEDNDVDAAMDVDEETENVNADLEVDKTEEHSEAKIDELMDTEESAYVTDKVVDAEEVASKVTDLPDSEKVLDKTGIVERDVDKSYGLLLESALGESSEPASAEEMLDRLNDLEESERVLDETSEVPPDTSTESANVEEMSEISKTEGSEKVEGVSCELSNEIPLGMAEKSDVSVNESNELLGAAALGKTDESSEAEESFDTGSELSKEVGLIKTDGCTDVELAGEAALDNTTEFGEAKAILDRTDELSSKTSELSSPPSNKSGEAANDEETLDESIKEVDEPVLDETDKLDNLEAISDNPDELMNEVALDKPNEPGDAEVMSDKPDESTLSKTEELDAKATEVTLGKEYECMDTEETSPEDRKLAIVEGTIEDASKEEPKLAKTPDEDEKCSEGDKAVSEESVDTKEKLDVVSEALPDSAPPEKCLESKPEKDADVAADKTAVKRLASEDDVVTEVKRTKVEGMLVTDDISRSEEETKEVNGEVFRTAGKRLSEPVEVGETKKPRLHLESEISDDGAADIDKSLDSDHTMQPEDDNKVEAESEHKEEDSGSDKVTNSTKEEEETLHVDSKTSSEAALKEKDSLKVSSETELAEKNSSKVSSEAEPAEKESSKVSSEAELAEKDALKGSSVAIPAEKDALKASSEAAPAEKDASEKESDKPNEAAEPKNDTEPPKPPPPKQMSNLDLAIERVVAAAAAAADAEEAARTAPIDIDDDDDEVVETAPTKSSEPKKLYSLPFMDKLHSNIVKKMGRNELEEFVMQKVCEVLTERCQLGRLRQQVQALEEQNESWRKKTQMLQKQLKDLDLVMKRFVNDSRMKRDRPFPVKVTRSVGLQVHMSGNGPLQAGKQRPSGDNNTRNQPTHRRRSRVTQNTSQSTQSQSQPATTTAATSTSTTSTTTVQQPQLQPPQPPTQTIQQQQTSLAQMTTTTPTQPMKTMQPNARSPICSSLTLQKVVAPNLAKMGTTATIVNPRTSTSNYANTAVKPTASNKQPVPIRPAITTVPTQNTITMVNSTAGSLSTGLRVASASQLNSRTIRPGVTATLCPVSKANDSKVIDLTDEDDKSKLNIVRFTTSSTATPVNNTAVTTAATGVHSGAIRVVHPHQLTGNTTTTILAAGNQQPQSRFAYLMPSSASPGQQRQVLIATSAAQVRPSMVTMSNRPAMSSATFLLKNGSMLPLQQPSQAQTVTNAAAILRPAASIQQPGALQTVRAGQPVRVSPSLVGRLPTTNMPIAPALSRQHPAPLPSQPACQPNNPLWKCPPPKPELKTSRVNNNKQQGIVLSWNMQLTPEFEEIASYQLFAYQEGPAPPNTSLWKKVGDVKALPLPMACTLTQFMEGHKYHFAVRAVDVHSRVGPFSAPRNIVLTRK